MLVVMDHQVMRNICEFTLVSLDYSFTSAASEHEIDVLQNDFLGNSTWNSHWATAKIKEKISLLYVLSLSVNRPSWSFCGEDNHLLIVSHKANSCFVQFYILSKHNETVIVWPLTWNNVIWDLVHKGLTEWEIESLVCN